MFCCSCCTTQDNEESEPLLHSHQTSVVSARSSHTYTHAVKRIGRLVIRRVCVLELDKRFSDMAEAFNDQQEHYEAMVRHIRNVRQLYGCNNNDTLDLTECMKNIREEHEAKHRVALELSGYDFSLIVVPVGSAGGDDEEPVPPHLKLAKDELKGASDGAKATISKSTTLQELTGWLIRSRDQMAEQVKGAAATYQEQGRLLENLEQNIMEVRRARELSLEYKQCAAEVLTEVAQIAGASV